MAWTRPPSFPLWLFRAYEISFNPWPWINVEITLICLICFLDCGERRNHQSWCCWNKNHYKVVRDYENNSNLLLFSSVDLPITYSLEPRIWCFQLIQLPCESALPDKIRSPAFWLFRFCRRPEDLWQRSRFGSYRRRWDVTWIFFLSLLIRPLKRVYHKRNKNGKKSENRYRVRILPKSREQNSYKGGSISYVF